MAKDTAISDIFGENIFLIIGLKNKAIFHNQLENDFIFSLLLIAFFSF